MLDDEEIIARYFSRDEAAVTATSEKYGEQCYGVSYNILRVREDAEECVSDSYLRVWNSVPPNRPPNIKCYLLKIVRNISLDRLKFLKRQRRSRELEISFSELENILPDIKIPTECETTDLANILNAFLETLSQTARIIMVARYWYFMSVAEISGRYGFSQSNVKTNLSRSREKLRKYLVERGVMNEYSENNKGVRPD